MFAAHVPALVQLADLQFSLFDCAVSVWMHLACAVLMRIAAGRECSGLESVYRYGYHAVLFCVPWRVKWNFCTEFDFSNFCCFEVSENYQNAH